MQPERKDADVQAFAKVLIVLNSLSAIFWFVSFQFSPQASLFWVYNAALLLSPLSILTWLCVCWWMERRLRWGSAAAVLINTLMGFWAILQNAGAMVNALSQLGDYLCKSDFLVPSQWKSVR